MATFESEFDVNDEVFFDCHRFKVKGVYFVNGEISYRLESDTRVMSAVNEDKLKSAPKEMFVVVGDQPSGELSVLSAVVLEPEMTLSKCKHSILVEQYNNLRIMKLIEIEEQE
jgi:hypothetical protein